MSSKEPEPVETSSSIQDENKTTSSPPTTQPQLGNETPQTPSTSNNPENSASSSSSSSSQPPSPPTCTQCKKPSPSESKPLKECSNCHTVSYCSRDCQKAHFKTHKKVCAKLAQEYAKSADFKMEGPRRVGKEAHRGGLQKWQFDT